MSRAGGPAGEAGASALKYPAMGADPFILFCLAIR